MTDHPLGSAFGRAALADDGIAEILLAAPPEQRIPVLLIAAAHRIVLAGDPHHLRDWYPTVTANPRSDDPIEAVTDFCRERRATLTELVAEHRVQTNEVGRCSILLPAIAEVAAERGPLALIDVGASAGLNLHLDRYGYDWSGRTLQPEASVQLTCRVDGPMPVPERRPPIAWRIGLDRDPVDVHDDRAVDWLRACTWADQPERLRRLEAAVAIARRTTFEMVRGDAVADIAALVSRASDHGHPVVTTSWVLNYLTHEQQVAYVDVLEKVGRTQDLTWLFAESPARTPGLPHPDVDPEDRTALTLVRWRSGRRHVRRLAIAHPHGAWLTWRT